MSKPRHKMSLKRVNFDRIPLDVKGVYAFWCRTNGKCVYVGKAELQPIRTRLVQEWRNSHNADLKLWIQAFGDFLDICYLPIKAHKKIDKIETKLIQMWKPETNIRKQ